MVPVTQRFAQLTVPTVYVHCAANSDIFFDETLHRLSGNPAPRLHDTRTVLALLKWHYIVAEERMAIGLRIDSQGEANLQ
jgi:hypothetical protein